MVLSELGDINREIKLKLAKPVYLLHGKDSYLKDIYLDRLTKMLLPQGITVLNHNKINTKPLDLLNLEDLIYQIPFNDRIVVVINDFDISLQSDKEIDRLATLMEEVSTGVSLVIVIRQEGFDAKKTVKAKKLIAAADKNGVVFELSVGGKNHLVDFIVNRAEKNNCVIDNKVANELIEWCSDSLDILVNEVDKLCHYAVSGHVSIKMVWDVCSISIEGNIYQISKKILAGNVSGVMSEIDALLYNKTDPIKIITTLGYNFADLLRVKAGMDCGKSAAKITKDFKMRSESIVNYIMRDIKRIDIEKLSKANLLVLEAEYKLKSATYQSRTLLEQLVVEMIGELRG